MTTVDLFADVASADETAPQEQDEPVAVETTEATEAGPVVLTELPAGALGVTEFANMLTMAETQTAEGELIRFPFGIVAPQTVYQATKAKTNPIPHALVQEADWPKPQLFILNGNGEGETYWAQYHERNSKRGVSSGVAASKRSLEDLLDGFSGATKDHEYNKSRLALWTANVEKSQTLLDKYAKWLDGAGATAEQVSTAATNGQTAFTDEQEKKKADAAARKAAKVAEKVEA